MAAPPPKAPPRFVPTLTEVVQVPTQPAATQRPMQPPAAPVRPSAPPAASATVAVNAPVPVQPPVQPPRPRAAAAPAPSVPARLLPDGAEEYMVHRVMQRVDVVLDQRLREAIATVVQEQTRSVLPRLREEIESVVRHAVYEAVAEELASGAPPGARG